MIRTILALAALLWTPPALCAQERTSEHVVLISIDGLRPEFYLDRSWPAPMIQQMRREGTHARGARGVYPSVTYPTHTTILTGARPTEHGIYYNSPFEPEGQTGRWYWEADAIRVPTLWDAVREAGLTSANLSWPVSVGAPVDWNLPEIWSLESKEMTIEELRRVSHPPGLWEEIEREASGRLTLDNFDIDWITRDDRAGDIAAHLLTTHRPNLMTVHFVSVDHFQHEDGRESDRVRRALATVDSAISQIVEAAEREQMLDRTTFIITGDHGFIDIHTRLAPNVWLADEGLLGRQADRGTWRAAFHTTAASAFLHLADPEDEDALQQVRRILLSLPASARGLFRVMEREELDRLGAAPEAVLGLALKPGVDATSTAESPAMRGRGGANHGYLPDYSQMRTGFLAWGPGILPGIEMTEIGLVDIAPLVAHLLGLELDAPSGVLPTAAVGEAASNEIMTQQIVRALAATEGERIIIRFEPESLPGLAHALKRALSQRGAAPRLLPWGPVDDFDAELATADAYIWLPLRDSSIAYVPDQIRSLSSWLALGGRQIHFHWGDGTRSADGLNLPHDETFDRIYLDALEIDYQALSDAQLDAEASLRSGEIHITTPAGTDLWMRIGDRPMTRQNGDASRATADLAVVPIAREIELPAGAIRVAPIESSVSGTLVVPVARFRDGVVEGLRLVFDDGRIAAWSADRGREHFSEALEAQPALEWFRELGIGFNPKLTPPPGDPRLPYYGYGAGVVRLSLGNNLELGGEVDGIGTRWLFFSDATVRVGSETLVQDGRLPRRAD